MPGKLKKRIRQIFWGALLVALLGPALIVGLFRWVDPPTSSMILQARVEVLRDGGHWRDVGQRWVDIGQVSRHLQLAVIAAEDQRFPDHWGLDLEAIGDALEDRSRGRVRGASTLTQQVAKNLFLWPGRSWARKGLEAYLSLWIEALWPKRRILEVYLNIAQFTPRHYGAAAASNALFGIPPSRLTPRQAALMAAVLPAPNRRNAAQPSAYVAERAAWISAQMSQLGYAYLDDL